MWRRDGVEGWCGGMVGGGMVWRRDGVEGWCGGMVWRDGVEGWCGGEIGVEEGWCEV